MQIRYGMLDGDIFATRDTPADRPGLWTVERVGHPGSTVYLTDNQFASAMAHGISGEVLSELPSYEELASIDGVVELGLLP